MRPADSSQYSLDPRDLLIVLALVLLTVGVGMLSIPAALIVLGSLLLLLGVWPLLRPPGVGG